MFCLASSAKVRLMRCPRCRADSYAEPAALTLAPGPACDAVHPAYRPEGRGQQGCCYKGRASEGACGPSPPASRGNS
eukprot:scaffold3455_cov213-Prasinococcus_capsulatus_cf.AAC.1